MRLSDQHRSIHSSFRISLNPSAAVSWLTEKVFRLRTAVQYY